MHTRLIVKGKGLVLRPGILAILLISLVPSACSASTPAPTPTPKWDWFNMELTDVATGEAFTMNDFSGKVVLVQTMAMWCPTCLFQAAYVRKLHRILGDPEDLISVSLDVDIHEDEASLKDYIEEYGFEWRFAVAPLLVARSLGNLYSAEYLNPPLSPMLLIDRDGTVHQLEYGLKDAETLQAFVEPFLAP